MPLTWDIKKWFQNTNPMTIYLFNVITIYLFNVMTIYLFNVMTIYLFNVSNKKTRRGCEVCSYS